MPLKKDYGPQTRSSERLTAARVSASVKSELDKEIPSTREPESSIVAAIEPITPAAPAEEAHDSEPDRPINSVEESDQFDSAHEDNDSEDRASVTESIYKPPSVQSEHSPSRQINNEMPGDNNNNSAPAGAGDNNAALFTQLLQQIEKLAARIPPDNNPPPDQGLYEPNRSQRGVTPMDSAFGGTFKPTGFAALPAFKPYGKDQNSDNEKYDPKARESRFDPGIFSGNKDEFDLWITRIADKCRKDARTFAIERDRMVVVNTHLAGNAARLVQARFISTTMPYTSTAEMVAVLASVYHNDNQASEARQKLAQLMYNPAAKDADIHQFIGHFNSLADRSNVLATERKMTLYEHVPASLGSELLTKAKNVLVSYEEYCSVVADAALHQKRVYTEAQARARKEAAPAPTRRSRTPEYLKKDHRPATDQRPVTRPVQNNNDRGNDECHLCHKKGHWAKDCPDRKNITRLLAKLEAVQPIDPEPSSESDDAARTDSSSENE